MRKQAENICKFVTESSTEALSTSSFVLEKNVPSEGYEYIRKANVMHLCLSGSGRLSADAFEGDILPGMLFFTFSGEKVRLCDLGGFEYMYISFEGQKSDILFERFGISKASRVFRGFEGLFSFWQSALGRADSMNLDLISESVLLYSFSQMSESGETNEEYLTGNIISHIETYFSDRSLSLASTAARLGYNPKYLSRVFSKNTGSTFSEYLRSTRIKHAIFLIEQGVTSVKNVAILSGYSDPLYFSNVFRSVTGLSPSEYIGKARGEREIRN